MFGNLFAKVRRILGREEVVNNVIINAKADALKPDCIIAKANKKKRKSATYMPDAMNYEGVPFKVYAGSKWYQANILAENNGVTRATLKGFVNRYYVPFIRQAGTDCKLHRWINGDVLNIKLNSITLQHYEVKASPTLVKERRSKKVLLRLIREAMVSLLAGGIEPTKTAVVKKTGISFPTVSRYFARCAYQAKRAAA